jgi:hypothetical protein
MAAIDFPASPTVGQTFTPANGVTYMWNGTLWLATGGASAGGDFFGTGAQTIAAGGTVQIPIAVTVGNSGGWYNGANGRFTPPPGRYKLFAGSGGMLTSAATIITTSLRKNGAVISAPSSSSGGANFWVSTPVEATVDANGTDYFEAYANSNNGTSNAGQTWFGAFPISGVQGPPGIISNGYRLIERKTIPSAVATLDFTSIPTDINDLELRLDLSPVSNDTGLFIKFYDTGVLQNTNYVFTTDASQTNMGGGIASAVMNSVALGSAVAGALSETRGTRAVPNAANIGGLRARATFNNIRSTTRMRSYDFTAFHLSGDSTTWVAVTGSGGRNVTAGVLTGLQLLFGTGNIAAGGTASLWGSP